MNVYLVQYLLLVLLVNAAVPKMTAVDKISALQVQPFNKESFIDIRHVKLSDQKEGADGEGVYNPRHFRSPKSPISTWMAYFNLIRSMLGPGLLIMPLNMSMAGVLAGSFIICGTGLLLIHTHSLLLDSLNEVSRQLKIPYISYRYGFRLALLHGPPVLRRLGNKGPDKISKLEAKPHHRDSLTDIRKIYLRKEKPVEAIGEVKYNPRIRRTPKAPISTWMAYFELMRTMLGPGLLMMPLSVSVGGVIAGPFIIIGTGLLLMHTHLLLLDCLNEVSRQLKIPHIPYRYGFRLALLHGPPILRPLGNKGPAIIATFMIMSQVGICTAGVISTAENLKEMLDWRNNKPALFLMLVPFLFIESTLKYKKWLAYVSLLSTGLSVVGLVLVFYFMVHDAHGKPLFTKITPHLFQLLFVFGATLYNLTAVGVILMLDKRLENPTAMVKPFGVIRVGMAIPTVIATVLGLAGYWAFGNMEENVLRSLPFNSVAMVCTGAYMTTVALTYPLNCAPAISVIKELIQYSSRSTSPPSDEFLAMVDTLARPAMVLVTFTIALIAPFKAPIVAFVGNLCTSQLALVFPALMDIGLRYPNSYGQYRVILLKDIAIVIIGIIAWIVGVVFCAYLIYVRVLASRSVNNRNYF